MNPQCGNGNYCRLIEQHVFKASEALLEGKYDLGTINPYGQRLMIPIELVGPNGAGTIETGRIPLNDWTIKRTTPFAGSIK